MSAYDVQAELLKMLGHPVRLQILDILRDGEQCVCHIEAVLGLRQAYISQQLMALRKARLVSDRRDGVRVFYSVTDPSIYAILDVARSLIGRQARREGRSLSFAVLTAVEVEGCNCPKCASPVSPVFA